MDLKDRFQNLAFKLFNQREFDKALKLIDRGLEENPENFDFFLLKGDILSEMDELDRAQDQYVSALEIANKKGDNFERLICLMKIKKIQGETNELNSKIFLTSYPLKLRKLCEDSLEKLLREDVIESSYGFIENIINEILKENESLKEFLKGILYFYIDKEEGRDILNNYLYSEEKINELGEYGELISKIKGKSGIDLKKLEEIINVENLSERKLKPSESLELANLLKSIGSVEEAVIEYLGALYSYIAQEGDIDKALEILNNIKELQPDDERIEKIENFLRESREDKGETGIKIDKDILMHSFKRVLLPEEDLDNWIKFLNLLSVWNMFDDVMEHYNDLVNRKINVDLYSPYFLYSLYMIGEYEEVIKNADNFIEQTESSETLKYLKYFKALSLHKLEEKEKALEIFASLYEQDPSFLDVKDYIEEKVEEEVKIAEKPLEEEEVEAVLVEEASEEEIEEIETKVEKEPKAQEVVEISKKPLKEHFLIL